MSLLVLALIAGVVLAVVLLAIGVAQLVRHLVRRPAPSLGRPPAGPRPDGAAGVRRARRRVATWRWAGVLTGALAACWTAIDGSLGRGLLLAPAVFAITVVVAVLGGELTVRPLTGSRRSALLRPRRVRDYLPLGQATVVAVTGVALAALVTTTTLTGSADDLGRAGRSLAGACHARTGWAAGPWPGSFYSLPLAALLVVGLGLAALTARRTTSRPRAAAGLDAVADDDTLRRHAGGALTAACGVLVSAPLAGLAEVSAVAMRANPCPPAWWYSAEALLAVVALGSLLLVVWWVAILLVPADRADRADPQRQRQETTATPPATADASP